MIVKTPRLSIIFLLVTLIIGIVVGYGVNDVITSSNIDSLRQDIEDRDEQIIALRTTIDQLEENVTDLMVSLTDLTELYDELVENTVPKIQYESLLAEHLELTENHDALEAQASSLLSVNEDLTEENRILTEEYEDLLAKYSEFIVQSWTYFEAHGLRVNLTTTATSYNKNKPIVGSISIYYEDNEPFNGTISLMLWSDYYSSGTASDKFLVYGHTDYSFSYPFIQGPGTYYLRVSEIRDAGGFLVVTYNEARMYSIKIMMG